MSLVFTLEVFIVTELAKDKAVFSKRIRVYQT